MKRVDFELAETSQINFDRHIYEKALSQLNTYKELFDQHRDIVTGYWIGWKSGTPYIMVAVEQDKSKEPEKLLPDKLGEYEVYFIEGKIHL